MGTKIKFIQVNLKVDKNNVNLLQILDAIKSIKKIPDSNLNENYKILKYKISELSQKEQEKIRDIALNYSPITRALLGSILEEISSVDLSILENSLNAFTKFNIDIDNIKNKKRWNIYS